MWRYDEILVDGQLILVIMYYVVGCGLKLQW